MSNLTRRPVYTKATAADRKRDEEFLAWIRTQPSCISGGFSEYVNGKGRNPACHVRRVSRGSGTGKKPLFSAIPLTNEEHQLSHQLGLIAVLPEEMLNASPCGTVAEWEEWQADVHFRRWLQLAR